MKYNTKLKELESIYKDICGRLYTINHRIMTMSTSMGVIDSDLVIRKPSGNVTYRVQDDGVWVSLIANSLDKELTGGFYEKPWQKISHEDIDNYDYFIELYNYLELRFSTWFIHEFSRREEILRKMNDIIDN